MEEERDMFIGLGWKEKIRSLGNLHVLFNPSPKYEKCAPNRYKNDYKMILRW
jgi:hypothetical protein